MPGQPGTTPLHAQGRCYGDGGRGVVGKGVAAEEGLREWLGRVAARPGVGASPHWAGTSLAGGPGAGGADAGSVP